ncbi:hypothetical protein GCM10027447_27990 [Glycomyces halotolerans]
MDNDRAETMNAIAEATKRLIGTVGRLSDEEARRPSRLEGWTRAHVVTHIARSGDAMCAMLNWAATGEGVPGYASPEAREAGIRAGGEASVDELVTDLTQSAAAFAATVEATPDRAWEVTLRSPAGATFPATEIPARRLVEVELHHTDLGTGYEPSDWTRWFADLELGDPMRTWRSDRLRWGRSR